MHVESIKRWQWMIAGLVLGLAMGFARSLRTSDLSAYGEGINDQRTFERRVLTNVNGLPMFKDVVVTRQTLNDGAGGSESVYIVAGKSVPENARAGERYQPMWFAAHAPYKPAFDLSAPAAAKNPQAAAHWKNTQEPTVVDWLHLAHVTAGVSYTNAWWDTHPIPTFTLGSFVLIGIIWPFAVNFYYFRSLWRPKSEKGISLRGIKLPPSDTKKPVDNLELDHLKHLEQEVEATMRSPTPTAVAQEAHSTVQPLTSDAPPVVVDQTPDDRHFVADPDDFYPTDERMHHK